MKRRITPKFSQVKRITSGLFDIRPVTDTGDLDIERIKQVKAILNLRQAKTGQETEQRGKALKVEIKEDKPVYLVRADEILQEIWRARDIVSRLESKPLKKQSSLTSEEVPSKEEIMAGLDEIEAFDNFLEDARLSSVSRFRKKKPGKKKPTIAKPKKEPAVPSTDLEQFYFPEVASQDYAPISKQSSPEPVLASEKGQPKSVLGFLVMGFLIALIIPSMAWLSQGLAIKEDVLSSGSSAYQNLLAAQQSLEKADWQGAEENFALAHSDFLKAHQEINKLGQATLGILKRLPGGSLVSSGNHLVRVGENLAQAGQGLAAAINLFSANNLFDLIEPPAASSDNILASQQGPSLTEEIILSQDNLNQALTNIQTANQELEEVDVEALPDDIQPEVVSLKQKLPLVEEMLVQVIDYSGAFLSILGHDNPRQYLLVFQNNSEIRATGGFIGTYGLLTLDRGEMTNLSIEGVFNADGQLHEKIVPPQPIQKISTAWSMHDANWFADFPSSAQKIAWFYEKTGGPTVDGVISLTPTLIERLLELTGPITMSEYEVVLSAENFVELVQYKVEVDYDKEVNRPKQILADFAPKFIEALGELSLTDKKQAVEIIFDCFKEKHILIYFKDPALQKLIIEEGWAGQLLETDKDYLSVVSSNINGYKTDRMVEETIVHQAEIQDDGSVIDTLTITRQHQGGQEKYDWWNRVNANYLRVYLPLGSQLISARGQSLEVYQPPIDYQAQGFKIDSLVSSIERTMSIDQKTGTHIFEENNKTVFGNWLYVSPGRTVTLTYQYKLPFKVDLTKPSDSYSLLVQKQSGSLGSQFSHNLQFPTDWALSWQYPEEMNYQSGLINYQKDLSIDRFLGVTFGF